MDILYECIYLEREKDGESNTIEIKTK